MAAEYLKIGIMAKPSEFSQEGTCAWSAAWCCRAFLFEIATFKSQEGGSFVVKACDFCFAHVNLHTRPLAVTVDASLKIMHIVCICRHEISDYQRSIEHLLRRHLVTGLLLWNLATGASHLPQLPFNIGKRGHPCLRPRCGGILADFPPSAWTTRMCECP